MLRCEKCGAKLPDNVKRCPTCGQSIKKSSNLKIMPMITSGIIILFSLIIGGVVIYTKISNDKVEIEVTSITKTYSDYEEWKQFFVADAIKVKPYKEFFDDTIKKYHNNEYDSYHIEEFIVDKGVLIDAYFLEDLVYKNTEMTMAMYYDDGPGWKLVLQYQTNKNNEPVCNDEMLMVFSEIASLHDYSLKSCFTLFMNDFEDKAYLKEYYIKDGTIKFTYYDQVTSYELVLPISLN